ncbi:hypothetical protein KFE25_011268 [Diacronema lutheri]|uniref:phosphoglucomutase (alpha-D-glucose-1,6-bisphosphate-dependent) n=1 Tax=Diacronema lutheri TaxID=2081491 RepID=A0A8J5X1J3_DIALT|nr:hypothetical protein KFE25_011268 [Diacronema lutheri]
MSTPKPWTPQEVEEYLARFKVQDVLSEAVNDAVQHKASDPVSHIADYLGKAASADPLAVESVPTAPIAGQKPGTSGLRKKTRVWMEGHYLHNFVQATFDALAQEGVKVADGTLVVSGDGRFFNKEAIQTILKIGAANGVGRFWLGKDGLLSTPAVSAVVRSREGGFVPFGAFILSASHNPGGIDEDFGIKFNCENGGPAPEKLTEAIYALTTSISEIKLCPAFPHVNLAALGVTAVGERVRVEVFDPTDDHVAVLKQCFDFAAIKRLVSRPDFSLVYDSMGGVQGPYAKAVFCTELGLPASSLLNATPLPDFGGPTSAHHGHADPNLSHAVELIAKMGLDKAGSPIKTPAPPPVFGAAADGDADRNMILGANFFVTPSDSLAVIAANASAIPFFKQGLKACARSMPTSCALDRVAAAKGMSCFEVPTGWKFFGNLMDSGSGAFADKPVYTPFLCGEESFGTGSNHVREKDGMWAVLAWLSILAAKNEAPDAPLVSVSDIVKAHWATYGRNYYARYDYEGVDKGAATKMMEAMAAQAGASGTELEGGFTLRMLDEFAYTDPVDGSVSRQQGIRLVMTDGSRIVFRLSGTGVDGATVRLYLEKYEAPDGDLAQHPFEVIKPLAKIALAFSKLTEFTGRAEPSVIT